MKNKEIIIGIVVGLLSTCVGTVLYLFYIATQRNATFDAIWDFAISTGQISSVVVYGAALNFLAFFGFLKFNKEARAKGVLIVTIITAILVLSHKILF
ncbi:hypothetical protein [Kordia jejudonensis]|uniref:hypothetical protein n=1 Tax=Kordia jejudonensis TaxID=1348245 RepID=UPI0006294EF6|nr:hypothetical protein [Kordia jejudonensis]